MPPIVQILIEGRKLKPNKAVISPELVTRNVLADSPWGFVDLFLKRERMSDALMFWRQAKEFNNAAAGIALEASPLLHYYCFLNATKALLTAKCVSYDPRHGVQKHSTRKGAERISLINEGIEIRPRGVLPALSAYLGETETGKIHTLQQLLFNLPYVHRTYCLTFKKQRDLFIPLVDPEYVLDSATNEIFLRACLSEDFSAPRFMRQLPPSLIPDPEGSSKWAIRSVLTAKVRSKSLRIASDRSSVVSLNRSIRADVQYINGTQTLWYVKAVVTGPTRLKRFPLTLTLAAMHRLSELCRYRPMEFSTFLAGQKNWLLNEFIQRSPNQFIDEIASELRTPISRS